MRWSSTPIATTACHADLSYGRPLLHHHCLLLLRCFHLHRHLPTSLQMNHVTRQIRPLTNQSRPKVLLTSAASAMALLALLVALICSATTPSVEANLLLKFRTKWCCPICARNNPQAAAANAASRLWTFWNLPSSRNLHTLHVIAGHPPTVNTRYREFLRFLFYQNVWTLNCDPINDFKKRDHIGLGGLASSCYDSHFNRRQS